MTNDNSQADSVLEIRQSRARLIVKRMISQGLTISQAVQGFPEEERSLTSLLLAQGLLAAIARNMVALDGITQEQSDELEAFLELVTTFYTDIHYPGSSS